MTRGASSILVLLIPLALVGYQISSFLPELLGVGSRYVSIPVRALIAALAVYSVWMGLRKRNLLIPTAWAVALVAFLLMYLLRILNDTVYFPQDLGRPAWEYGVYAVGMCFIPMFGFCRALDQPTGVRAYRWTVFALIIACGLIAVTGWGAFGSDFERVYANDGLNPITMGHAAVSLVLLLMWGVLCRNGAKVTPATMAVGSSLAVGVLLLSGSRGPFVTLLLGVLLLAFCSGIARRVSVGRRLAIAIASTGAIMVFVALSVSVGSGLLDRFEATSGRVEAGEERRMIIWTDAVGQFVGSPLTGSGIVEQRTLSYPHNVLIEGYMATGAVGGTLLAAVLLWGLIASFLMLARDVPNSWLGILYIQQFIWAMLSGAIYLRPELWYLLGAVVANHAFLARALRSPGRRVGQNSAGRQQYFQEEAFQAVRASS